MGTVRAVATESKALIVVAEDHRDEFVSVANYLNDVAGLSEGGITVWLVKVRAARRVGDEIWSPEFVVQADPTNGKPRSGAKHRVDWRALKRSTKHARTNPGPCGLRPHGRSLKNGSHDGEQERSTQRAPKSLSTMRRLGPLGA
jgi:hypothetical protein